mgnify:CR=1 FL=1
MRFLADMGVSLSVVDWLREQGHEALHLRDEHLQRMPDEQIFEKALQESRIILTFDLDFAEILAFSGSKDVSTVIFRLHNARSAHVIERLKVVLEESSAALEKGAVITVEERRHRVRYLPIGR